MKQREWFEVAQAIKTLGGAVTIDTDFIIFLWHPKAANLYRLQKITVTIREQRRMLEFLGLSEAEYIAALPP